MAHIQTVEPNDELRVTRNCENGPSRADFCFYMETSIDMPETTDKKQDTRFKPGQSGNPTGRPKGSRNKFSERLIEAFALDFETYGTDAIEKVRAEKPHEYLRIAASLVPKQFEIEDGRQPFAVIPGQSQSNEEWEREFTPIGRSGR
jgi:hypothetical protein